MKYTFFIKCSLICLLTPPTWLALGVETAAALPGLSNVSNVSSVQAVAVEDEEFPPIDSMESCRVAAQATLSECIFAARHSPDGDENGGPVPAITE